MSVTNTHNPVVLEPASQAVVAATVGPPFLYELSPAEARAVLDGLQSAPIDKPPVDDRWITVPAEVGDARVRIVRPRDAVGTLPVIRYMHGGGWVLGNADTHDRLVRELAVGTGAAVVFVEYDRSPDYLACVRDPEPPALDHGLPAIYLVARDRRPRLLCADRPHIPPNRAPRLDSPLVAREATGVAIDAHPPTMPTRPCRRPARWRPPFHASRLRSL